MRFHCTCFLLVLGATVAQDLFEKENKFLAPVGLTMQIVKPNETSSTVQSAVASGNTWYKTITPAGNTNLCIDLPGGDAHNGNMLWLWECNGLDSQIWVFDNWQIRYGPDENFCIDGREMQNNQQLMLWECNGMAQQTWGYDDDPSALRIYIKDTATCMDKYQGDDDNGQALHVWDCNGLENQQWSLWDSPDPSWQPIYSVLSHCDAGGDDGVALGWPKFGSQAELLADARWSAYIWRIYGEVPTTGYPICTYSFGFIYAPIFKDVGMSKTPEGGCPGSDPNPGWFYSTMVGHPYQASYASWIFNPNLFKGLPANTYVEVTHGTITNGEEEVGTWFYYTPGSAVWFNTGNTAAFKDHNDAVDQFIGQGQCPNSGCQNLFTQTFTAAKNQGYTSVQYYQHGDQSCGRIVPRKEGGTARQGAVEIVDVTEGAMGKYACGKAQGSNLRAGWEAKSDCDCDPNYKDGDSIVANCNGFGIRR